MTRTSIRLAVLLFAFTIAVSGAFVLQGAVAQEAGNQTTDNDTTAENESLEVTQLIAPESAAPGTTVDVAAEVQNPSDSAVTENLEYRVNGQVADTELVTVQPGESTVIQFTADTEDMDAGQIYHGVFTEDTGQVQQITLSESFTLESADAPESASVGDELTVEAEVSNPNDFETNQSVTLRLNGQVVDEERVTLDGGESDTVTFTVETDDLEAGEHVHGVFTRDDGQFLQLTLEEAVEETPTEEPVNETETPTEEPLNETETPTEEPLNETETPTEEPLNETETEEPLNVTDNETETEAPLNETETEAPLNETETEVPLNETETEEPLNVTDNETETEVPLNETETEEPLNVTDNETETEAPLNETETEAPLNETETEVPLNETETEEPLNVTDNETETPTEVEEEPSASVVFPTYNATMVTVNQVNLSDGGFVAIHNQTDDGEVGPVIGVSEYLEPGEHENVDVHLFNVSGAEFDQHELTESQTLIAMPHLDTNDNQTYDFVATEGAEDGPYTEDGEPVTDEAFIQLEDVEEPVEETETPTEEPVNETETPTEEPLNETDNETVGLNETETETPLNETDEEDADVTLNETNETDNETVDLNETETEAPLNETDNETEGLNETDEEDADVTLNETNETDDSLNATDNETEGLNETDNETEGLNETDNETVGLNETENETDGLNETDNETQDLNETDNETDGAEMDANASVEITNVSSLGTEVTVNTTLPDGGYVAIHNESVLANATAIDENETVNSTIGVSEYLEPGEHENVTITLFDVPGAEYEDDVLRESQILIAMPHQDTNDNQSFDYVLTNGSEDGPYTMDGEPIVAPAIFDAPDDNETLVGFNETDNETEGLNETDNETDGLNETDNETVGLNETETEAPLNETENETDGLNETDNETVGLNETDNETEGLNETDNETVGLNETETEAPLNETENETDGLNETDNETVGLNETDNETDNETVGVNETDNETVTVTAQTEVTLENQTANVTENGTEVTIESVTLSEGGFVAIHNESLLDGDAVGSVIGVSEYLEAGTHENLSVVLFNVTGAEFNDTELTENETMIAMPHLDTNGNETYDFVATNGTEDGPYTEDGEPVTDNATVAPPTENATVNESANETANESAAVRAA